MRKPLRSGPLGYVVVPSPNGRYRVKVIADDQTFEFNVPDRVAAFNLIETFAAVNGELPASEAKP